MNNKYKPTYYDLVEEKINVITHAFGLVASIIAMLFLVKKAVQFGNTIHLVSFIVFGLSLIVLYTASTLYHNATDLKKRTKLNIFDHASIYVLIAGTYTPFTLVTLNGKIGW